MGAWITSLIEDYKYVDGEHFGERKHWLHDDYVKFIRMAEHVIIRNPSGGVLGFITNHGYLDNPTFRGMRWHLLKTFDEIWVIDLHGNSNKKETAPDGSPDKNVFDIQQGVAVIVAVKRGQPQSKPLAKVRHQSLWGTRESKNEALWNTRLGPEWQEIVPAEPLFMLAPRDYSAAAAYDLGFSLPELFSLNVSGIITARDEFVIDENRSVLADRVRDFGNRSLSDADFQQRYALSENYQWKVSEQRKLFEGYADECLVPILYRQFDRRLIYYHDNLVFRRRREVMRHMLDGSNMALLSPKITGDDYAPLVTCDIIANKTASRYDQSYIFPLYSYPDPKADQHDAFAVKLRTHNLNSNLYAAICKAAGIDPAAEAGPEHDFRASTGDARPSEVKVFDYIYGVLHSPEYRETFAEFLKINFPRIPFPASAEVFRHISEKGEQLRRLHLMEPATIGETPYTYEGDGDDVVASGYPVFEDGKVYLNKDQYFASVPEIAWTFYIGGYQPAQKWLKDRRGRSLLWEDIGHYQKIVKILVETDRIMKEIELPID